MRTAGLAAVIILFTTQNMAEAAPPGPTDVVLKWTTEPKKVGLNVTMAGTVTFKNPWQSANDKVVVTFAPTAGGAVIPGMATLNANGTWSLTVPLTGFPNPAMGYGITASVQANTGAGTMAYAVVGTQKTLNLP